MHRLTSKLIIYRGIGEDSILRCLAQICRRFYEGSYDKEAMISEIYEQVHSLLDLATKYGFNKNLWHNYLAYLIATTESLSPRREQRTKAALTHLPSMISASSGNCSTMTSARSKRRLA